MNIVITTADQTTPDTLLAELAAGTAHLHKEREDGTYRRVHYLADGSQGREEAEWIAAQREGTEDTAPRSMRSIAEELNLSVSAVRRIISDLALTEELEAMDADELADMLRGAEEIEVPAAAFGEADN
jgi:hypothetical protein